MSGLQACSTAQPFLQLLAAHAFVHLAAHHCLCLPCRSWPRVGVLACLQRMPSAKPSHACKGWLHTACMHCSLGSTQLPVLAVQILLPVKERGHKDLSTGAAVGHLLQLGLINLVGAVMMLCSMRNPLLARAAYGTFGIVYALESTKLIMDHMSKEPFSIRYSFCRELMALKPSESEGLLLSGAYFARKQ